MLIDSLFQSFEALNKKALSPMCEEEELGERRKVAELSQEVALTGKV